MEAQECVCMVDALFRATAFLEDSAALYIFICIYIHTLYICIYFITYIYIYAYVYIYIYVYRPFKGFYIVPYILPLKGLFRAPSSLLRPMSPALCGMSSSLRRLSSSPQSTTIESGCATPNLNTGRSLEGLGFRV